MGSLAALRTKLRPKLISILTAFGAGALIAALTVELVAPTVFALHEETGTSHHGEPFAAFFALLIGAVSGGILFVMLDQLVNAHGGFLRKAATSIAYFRIAERKRQEKLVEKAVNIIETILDNHEGMEPDFPPRVAFNEFNPDSLNILVLYWYHPPDYWSFLAFSQRINLQIMREFKKGGIRFAFPTSTTYLTQDDDQPLQINFANDLQSTGQSELT